MRQHAIRPKTRQGAGVTPPRFAAKPLRFAAKPLRFAALTLFGALFLAACGGDEPATEVLGDSVVANESTTTTTAAPTTTVAPTTTESFALTGLPEFTADSSVTTVGIDAVVFGMTINQANEAVGGEFVPIGEANNECFLIRPAGGPLGVQLTVTQGTIERVDITNPRITTRSGAGVGMTEQGLADLFGASLTTQPSGGGNQVIFTPSDEGDAQFRVIFETDGETVTSFRAGRVPVVEPTIPCS